MTFKTKEEIEIIKESSQISSEIMKRLKAFVKPGISTKELDEIARNLILEYKAESAFLNYDGFPAVLCTSVNEVIVHGIPSDYKLKEGDIISLDFGVKYKGYYSDMAFTLPVGKVSEKANKLIRATRKSLELAIKVAKPGNRLGDIGFTIQNFLEKEGFHPIKELCGHGIGKDLHEDPQILNFGKRGEGLEIREGMVFCIEPMASIGDWRIKKAKDGYSWQTKDGSLSAHFEHTVAVFKNKAQNLTYF